MPSIENVILPHKSDPGSDEFPQRHQQNPEVPNTFISYDTCQNRYICTSNNVYLFTQSFPNIAFVAALPST
jgi:hypothetical protein